MFGRLSCQKTTRRLPRWWRFSRVLAHVLEVYQVVGFLLPNHGLPAPAVTMSLVPARSVFARLPFPFVLVFVLPYLSAYEPYSLSGHRTRSR